MQNQFDNFPVLIVEDDNTTSALLSAVLRENGLNTLEFNSAANIRTALPDLPCPGAALVDLGLPDGDGLDVIRMVRQRYPELPFYVLTAKNAVSDAVTAMKAGASDYIVKPFEPIDLVTQLKQSITTYLANTAHTADGLTEQTGFFKWKSPCMQETIHTAKQAAKTLSPVLISGPKNTGKKSIAALIHQLSSRSGRPFLHLHAESFNRIGNHGGQSEEEEHTIQTSRDTLPRRLERAGNATVFIENIDKLDASVQRSLAEWIKQAKGSAQKPDSTCRLITASTTDFRTASDTGLFLEELLYLISIYRISVPSLAERPEDFTEICEQALTLICVNKRLRRPTITRKAAESLMDHSWPGNLAELYNVLEHAATHTNDGLITADNLPSLEETQPSDLRAVPLALGSASIDELSRASLIAALQACEGNRRRAAQRLKVSLRTVYNMIQRYGINEVLPSGREMLSKRMRGIRSEENS